MKDYPQENSLLHLTVDLMDGIFTEKVELMVILTLLTEQTVNKEKL